MRKQFGGALVVTLVVLAGLVTVVTGFSAAQRAYLQGIQTRLDRMRAQMMAEAALNRAMAELVNVDPNNLLLSDEWSQIGETSGEYFTIAAGQARLQILDSGALIDINSADEQQLLNLGLTNEQVDSILDWREAGVETRPEGAKDEYYNSLADPYNAALREFRTIDELLMVKGMNLAALYTHNPETQATQPLVQGSDEDQPAPIELLTLGSSSPLTTGGQAKLNANTATAQQMVQRGIQQQLAQAIIQRRNTTGQFATLGAVLLTPGVNNNNAATILDNLTIATGTVIEGKINLNTAQEAVLNSISGMTPDITQAILTRQSEGFAGLGDLASLPGVSVQWLAATVDRFTIGGNVFQVRVVGEYGASSYSLVASIEFSNGVVRILSLEKPPYENMSARWGWAEEGQTEIVLAEEL